MDWYLDALRNDGQLLADTAAGGSLEADVPPCPGWTVRDAVEHTAEVYQHKIACMRLGRRPESHEWPHAPDPDEDVVGWFRRSLAELLGELTERGPQAPSYTWWPADQTVGFWYRRMAQETAVHRVDVQAAFDRVSPVEEALAVDGIDEVLERFLGDDWSDVTPEEWGGVDPQAGAGRTVAVRTGDSCWRVQLGPERIEVDTSTEPADATVSGTPSELLLWLWRRRPDTAVAVEGDGETVVALRDRLYVATQ
jgi:uncharacterized protein (TIGR03083 family)